MEVTPRTCGDELLPSGALSDLRQRLRQIAHKHDLATVIANSYDYRTKMLPFATADLSMAPAGVRAIGSAMVDAGFDKTRIVLLQWNRNFRPSRMELDGRIPDIFMVSAMQLHTASMVELIQDACRIDPEHKPLIIVGGPKIIYEPWDAFGTDSDHPWGADVAITGEEYILLSLLERVLETRATHESVRSAFLRARDAGMLNDIPGLVYPRTSTNGTTLELFDTGPQRLLGELDETPHPVLGYKLLEMPSKSETLGAHAMPQNKVRKYSPLSSLVLTFGCRFSCPYCPIPAYNQRKYRTKSGERIADEFTKLNTEYGLGMFFGADDNFFNNREKTTDIIQTLARTEINGKPIRKVVRWATEVTISDTLKYKDLLPDVRNAGVRALWAGVEDMTATLVKKGQSVNKTVEALQLMQKNGICAMPMMMHHDEQPLISRGPKPYGLLNQLRILRKADAISIQVLMLTPAPGSKLFEETYTSGMAYKAVGSKEIGEHMLGGNYVIASNHPKPWRKQFNILASYLYFYNPARFLLALVRPKSKLYLADAIMQGLGMRGLVLTIRRTIGWGFRLRFGKIKRCTTPPGSKVPVTKLYEPPAETTRKHKEAG